MNRPMRRGLALLLVGALGSGLVNPPTAAAENGEATNLTLGVGAIIVAVVAVIAWQDDFGKNDGDDMITRPHDLRLTPPADDRLALVLTDWQTADPERCELVSGLGFRAWF